MLRAEVQGETTQSEGGVEWEGRRQGERLQTERADEECSGGRMRARLVQHAQTRRDEAKAGKEEIRRATARERSNQHRRRAWRERLNDQSISLTHRM